MSTTIPLRRVLDRAKQLLRLCIPGAVALTIGLAAVLAAEPDASPRAEFQAALESLSKDWAQGAVAEVVADLEQAMQKKDLSLTEQQVQDIGKGLRSKAFSRYVIRPWHHPVRKEALRLAIKRRVMTYLVVGPVNPAQRETLVKQCEARLEQWGKQLADQHPDLEALIEDLVAWAKPSFRGYTDNPLLRRYARPADPELLDYADQRWQRAIAKVDLDGEKPRAERRFAIRHAFNAGLTTIGRGTKLKELPVSDRLRVLTEQLIRGTAIWTYEIRERARYERKRSIERVPPTAL